MAHKGYGSSNDEIYKGHGAMKHNTTYNKKMLHVNLQLFADSDKTEKATPKKKQDARKKTNNFLFCYNG